MIFNIKSDKAVKHTSIGKQNRGKLLCFCHTV